MKYFAKIKYLGTNFHGFQVQPDKRTVQGEVCRALTEALGGSCKVTGCSRTDAGVHANEFCLTVEAEGATVPPEKLPLAVARFLPTDLSLFYAEEASADFHPRYDVVSKEYVYKIYTADVCDPVLNGRVWHYTGKLVTDAVERMNACAEKIVGKKDFTSFMAAGSKIEDAVRTVHYCDVSRDGDMLTIRIAADGFLYNMVRIIAGTLMQSAAGKLTPCDIESIICSKDRSTAGLTAPPDGLYLNKVNYS